MRESEREQTRDFEERTSVLMPLSQLAFFFKQNVWTELKQRYENVEFITEALILIIQTSRLRHQDEQPWLRKKPVRYIILSLSQRVASNCLLKVGITGSFVFQLPLSS